ncbi:MAG: nodulation protein NfeD [Thermoplasmata archaeon]|nr:MAG: nodulation protein NfeD [Thermoplasmata archaeon]
MKLKHSFIFFFILFFLFLSNTAVAANSSVLIMEMKDTIDQSSVELLKSAVKDAEKQGNEIIILTLNTPGGGVAETFVIADIIQNSSIPIIGFVSPKGAYAWSAGTFILMSTHLAAMTDHSIIGSCQPVEIGLTGSKAINDSKTINALVSWLQERASIYGRNRTLAKEFITQNRNVNASTALSLGVIEFTASSVNDLLEQIDGYVIVTVDGNKTIVTSNASIVQFSPPFQIILLKIISNPLLTSLLFMLGVFAIIFGISSPGFGAEVFGVIAILFSLIGSGFSISELSLIFLGIGAVLLFIEFFVTPGFGVIGAGGVICFIVGSIFLIPTYSSREWVISMNYIQTGIVVIIAAGVLISVFFVFLLYKVLEVRNKKKAMGVFIGETAFTVDILQPQKTGYVRFKGELWKAESNDFIKKDTKVKILKKDGLLLTVEALK